MSIPVHNVYYLLCYAWDALDQGLLVDVETTHPPHVIDLLASVLGRGIEHLLRRGLDRDYQEHVEQLPTVRGRIELGPTIRFGLQQRGQVQCRFDELSHDVLQNRILKTTVARLVHASELDPTVRRQLSPIHRRLARLEEVPLTPATFGRVRLQANRSFYRFLLHICELVAASLAPDEGTGETRFRDFLRDEQRMARLFERFVFNFFCREQSAFAVKRDRFLWDAAPVTPSRTADLDLLPQMETDISLRSAERTLIIDTKYYHRALVERFAERPKLRSTNLYQLHAYLSNLEQRPGPDSRAEGLLLYPDVHGAVDVDVELRGHRVRVKTLDLSQRWSHIHDALLGLLDEPTIKTSTG